MTTKLPPAQGRPIRVVPMRGAGGLVAPAPPVRAPSAAQLTYRGGPLLTAVEVVTAFWGVAWNEATAQATVQALNSFFQFVVASPYLDQLAEYGTPQVKIGRGRYAGTARVTDTAPSASATDSAIQQMLEAAVARKSLPAPTANTVYFAFLPPGVTVVAGSERSCQAFCGYHDRSAGGLYYAVVPYPNCSGCLGAARRTDLRMLPRARRGDHGPGARSGMVQRHEWRDRRHLRLAEQEAGYLRGAAALVEPRAGVCLSRSDEHGRPRHQAW